MSAAKTPKSPHEQIHIYADGPTVAEMKSLDRGVVKGYTFNPTLFRSLGVTDYLAHCRDVVKECGGLPLSLEVFADDEDGMIRQARLLHALGDSVYVKIPITDTAGRSTRRVIQTLTKDGVRLNITAIFTLAQIDDVLPVLGDAQAILSVFAGRLYDIGRDAVEDTAAMAARAHERSRCRVLWASPRMVFDVKSAIRSGCDIITMQAGLIKKLSLFGTTPEAYSLETVKMFHRDAQASGYTL